eukprot:156459-Prymnesium_polylepis.1
MELSQHVFAFSYCNHDFASLDYIPSADGASFLHPTPASPAGRARQLSNSDVTRPHGGFGHLAN